MTNAMRRGFQLAILMSLFTFAIAFMPIPAFAQNLFVLVPGIRGSSLDQGHVGWIEALSITQGWDLAKNLNGCPITIAKNLDVAGPRLWLAAVTGQTFGEIRIEAVQEGDTPFKFYEIHLQNARISRINNSVIRGVAHSSESVTLSSANVILSFFTQNPDGTLGSAVRTNISCT